VQDHTRPGGGFHQGLHKIFAQGCTRSCKDLLERTSPGPAQDLRKRLCARSCKDLGPLRGFQQDLHKIFSQGCVQDQAGASQRISAGSAQHLVRRTCAQERASPGSPQDLFDDFIRITLCEPAQSKCTWTPFHAEFTVREGFHA
jgi:hypothetical protein